MWAMVNYPINGSIMLLGVISFVAGAASAITGPIVKSMLQNVSRPQMRGMVRQNTLDFSFTMAASNDQCSFL